MTHFNVGRLSRLPSSSLSREPITLTSADIRALAERLRARAASVVLRDTPSQQSDGILAAGALVHLVAELQALRGEIDRAASSTCNVAQHLRELLRDRAAHHLGSVTVRFDRQRASAGPGPARIKRSDQNPHAENKRCQISHLSGRSTTQRRLNGCAVNLAGVATCRRRNSAAAGDGSDSAPAGA